MTEALSIIIEVLLAFAFVGLILVADHVVVTRFATRRAGTSAASGSTVGTGVATLQSWTGVVMPGTQELKRSRVPAEWTVIKGLRDVGA